ncbi:2-polyprenylphenol 6-hydroxylase [Terricaulis silvestris]|uniref:Putative ubiquinone biosynthesis protein UbiB n=1 Tax=Terricaulis silvestris TaxID=2686094 RepID=A0A6I6MP36_9CAUL|nr:2-polyprenylphenol 6-hydroxylase [Terricaulis silvestris]QGZ97130.1 putative ubiquinone biosynthesis protein UbiB [Terricaulis silvestris]
MFWSFVVFAIAALVLIGIFTGVVGHIRRLLRVALTLVRYDVLLPGEYYDRYPTGLQAAHTVLSVFAKRRRGRSVGERLAKALERLGPAYVKVGQFLATRPDMIGVTVAQELGRLKDRLPPFSRTIALDTINSELGGTEELFAGISEAMAAASIAQVHQAIVPRQGVVAIKVLRPRIEKKMAKEMAALRFLAQAIETFSPRSRRLEPVQFIDTVAAATEREMDLRLEAGAAAEFREVAEKDGYLTVPNIDWSRSAKRVMTLDWIDGIPLTDIKALDKAGADRSELAIAITRGFLAAALDYGFFHADMHEGNLLYGKDGKLWIVDFGIMGRIGHKERRYLAEILYGFHRRDYRRVAVVHHEAGYVPEKFTVEEFSQALRAIGEPIFGKTADGISMSRLLLQLFDVTHMFGMHLRPELVLLQKTMVQVEGVARALDPRHDMWTASRPIVERWVERELGAEAVARRAVDEAAQGFSAMRRLPHTLTAIEAAARKVAIEAPRQERQWYQMPVFWLGLVAGGLIVLVFGPRPAPPVAQPMAETARIESPAPVLVRPTTDTTMPPVVDAPAEPINGEAPAAEPEAEKAAPAP